MSLEEMKLLDSCYTAFLDKYIFAYREKDHILGGKIFRSFLEYK